MLLGKIKLVLRKHLKVNLFCHQQQLSPVKIQLQLSALHPDPEITKASLILLTAQNVGSVFHEQEERGDRVDNKTRGNFCFRVTINMLDEN